MEMRANNILVAPESPEEQSIGTILLPMKVQDSFARGTVKAVGPGLWLQSGKQIPIEVAAGDRVLYFMESAAPLIVKGQNMHIIQEQQILAILEPKDFQDISFDENQNQENVNATN